MSRSLNAEIIKRLEKSFLEPNRVSRLVADAILEGLDPDVIRAMSERSSKSGSQIRQH